MNGIISCRFKATLDDYSELNSIGFLQYTAWKGGGGKYTPIVAAYHLFLNKQLLVISPRYLPIVR